MSKVGALAKLIKEGVTSNKIVGTPFSNMDNFENYLISEARRGALSKKNQKYFG